MTRRTLTPGESRALFDRLAAARQAEAEAALRSPAGEAARQTYNAATLARMRAAERRS